MGLLKPGATYVYERADGVTYAREAGAHPGDRIAIGWDYEYRQKQETKDQIILWGKIHQAAKTNPALQDALDRVIVLYELSKKNDNEEPMWHPV